MIFGTMGNGLAFPLLVLRLGVVGLAVSVLVALFVAARLAFRLRVPPGWIAALCALALASLAMAGTALWYLLSNTEAVR